ncbi:MAG: ATP phosphoribosyltransferase [Pseudomonadota bacterium]
MGDARSSRLRLAIQKSGRLADGTQDLLKRCGLSMARGRDKLFATITELPIDVLFVRDDDIPSLVADGVCDIGIVGENVMEEVRFTSEEPPAAVEMKLGFSRCRLMLAVEKGFNYQDAADLDGKRIATSYPGVLGAFFKAQGVAAHIVEMQGAVEVAPRMKLADAVCDIVSTGATLDANGLKPVETVFESEAVLIRRPAPFNEGEAAVFQSLTMRIAGVIQSRDAKYVMMNAPRSALDDIKALLPGADAPTVLELAGETDKVAVHVVCAEAVFWPTLEKLKAAGASAILVLPIEKMML